MGKSILGNVVVAIDSFKGSLSSLTAGNAVKDAILFVDPTANVTVCPVADGGEGTVDSLFSGLGGTLEEISVSGPLMKPVSAKYCILKDRATAVIEIASAAGIAYLSKSELNPFKTTTYGVGEIIKDALLKGCNKFIIGLGGSCTNDGGAGMLQSLGFVLLDKEGNKIPFGAEGLSKLYRISGDSVVKELKNATFRIACDVCNPLCGKDGCSAVFGPQKGANPESIIKMDNWLQNFAAVTESFVGKNYKNHKGAGAAGGLGFAFLAYTNSKLESGVDIIMEEIKIEEKIINSDFVVTGEGRLDSQTILGKAPIGIAKIAKKHNKPVIAFSGCATDDASVCNEYGIDAYFPILQNISTLDEALNYDNAYTNLINTAKQVFRLISSVK